MMFDKILKLIGDNPELVVVLILGLVILMPKTMSNIFMALINFALGRKKNKRQEVVEDIKENEEENFAEENDFVSIFLDTVVKMVFVFKDELFVPVTQEGEFVEALEKLIQTHNEKIIVFDLSGTVSMSETFVSCIRRIITGIADENIKLTIVLPNLDVENNTSEIMCKEIYSHVINTAERTQNFHLKVKYDVYGNTFPGFEEIYLHRFFEGVDAFLYHKIPHIDTIRPEVKKTIIALLGSMFTTYKYMIIRYMSMCKERRACFNYDGCVKLISTIDIMWIKFARKYGVDDKTIAIFSSKISQPSNEYIQTLKRNFENPWRSSLNERLSTILDGAMSLLSSAFDYTYEMIQDNQIGDSVLTNEVDLRTLRIEVSTDAFKTEF